MNLLFIFNAKKHVNTGPRNSVTLLAKYLMSIAGVNVEVFSTTINSSFEFNGIVVKPYEEKLTLNFDMVVFSGVWSKDNYLISRFLKKNKIKYIISPRSSLMKVSLLKSRMKKFTFLLLFARRYIKNAASIHFLTEDEKNNSIYNENGFVVGNIVESVFTCDKKTFWQKNISFLGRIDISHKGLDVFIDGVFNIKSYLIENDWIVKIAGPTMVGKNDLNILKEKVNKLGLDQLVIFEGPKYEADKIDFLNDCDIFVHTSRYEGQPQSVMEAMASGCAIFITPETNMSLAVLTSKCGLVTKGNSNDISKDLIEIIESNYTEMGRNAYKYYYENFNGEIVAERFLLNLQYFKSN